MLFSLLVYIYINGQTRLHYPARLRARVITRHVHCKLIHCAIFCLQENPGIYGVYLQCLTAIYNMMTLTISQRKPSTNSYSTKQSRGRDSERETDGGRILCRVHTHTNPPSSMIDTYLHDETHVYPDTHILKLICL